MRFTPEGQSFPDGCKSFIALSRILIYWHLNTMPVPENPTLASACHDVIVLVPHFKIQCKHKNFYIVNILIKIDLLEWFQETYAYCSKRYHYNWIQKEDYISLYLWHFLRFAWRLKCMFFQGKYLLTQKYTLRGMAYIMEWILERTCLPVP